MGLIIAFTFIALVIGIISVASSAGDWRRRQRIIATPTTPIAQASGDCVVEIKGKVVAGEQGVFTTPFSGRPAVFCRVTVQEKRSRGKSTYWHTVVEEVEARDFYVEDGSGQQARVSPRGANAVLDKQSTATSGTFNDAPPNLVEFLQARGHATTGWFGLNKSMQYLEEVLAPGDQLYAIGPSHREAGPPASENYRDSPSSRLVMSSTGSTDPDMELLISNKPEEELVSNLGGGMKIGLLMIGASVIAGLGIVFTGLAH